MMPRVLLVEDELLIRAGMRHELETLGCTIVGEASEGNQAVELARKQRPDLICMDIRLKGPMDGMQVARAIRDFSAANILFTSAWTLTHDIMEPQLQPCTFLPKPIPPGSLKRWLASAVITPP